MPLVAVATTGSSQLRRSDDTRHCKIVPDTARWPAPGGVGRSGDDAVRGKHWLGPRGEAENRALIEPAPESSKRVRRTLRPWRTRYRRPSNSTKPRSPASRSMVAPSIPLTSQPAFVARCIHTWIARSGFSGAKLVPTLAMICTGSGCSSIAITAPLVERRSRQTPKAAVREAADLGYRTVIKPYRARAPAAFCCADDGPRRALRPPEPSEPRDGADADVPGIQRRFPFTSLASVRPFTDGLIPHHTSDVLCRKKHLAHHQSHFRRDKVGSAGPLTSAYGFSVRFTARPVIHMAEPRRGLLRADTAVARTP